MLKTIEKHHLVTCTSIPPHPYFSATKTIRPFISNPFKTLYKLQLQLANYNNMSSSSISSSPRNHNPSKHVVVHRVPSLSINSNNIMHGSGHEDDHKSYSCSSGSVLQGSASVPRAHCSDGNDKDSGRERLKRHREEVAGRVSIPDKWGKEELLRDWMDYSSFDSLLAPTGLASARKALMAEGRRSSSKRFTRIGSIR